MTKLTLGWTLLHTLWQGAIVYGFIKMVLSFIPSQKANLRYAVNCAGMLLIVTSSIITYSYLNSVNTSYPSMSTVINSLPPSANNNMLTFEEAGFWEKVNSTINDNMAWIVTTWLLGVFVFMSRFIIGLIYIQNVKKKISEVSTDWQNKTKLIAQQLGINRCVKLAESIYISRPIVLGYLQPVILLPIGILTGLPASQIETILIHELSHIRRHDYLINLIQSVVEIILFFNPFVWVLSNAIRKEREHCCDDQVVSLGSNRIDYIKALAQLEEVNQGATPALALALNKNKFHVFNRIKRIMETSANQNQNKIRPFILVTLIVTGLVCTSWLTVGTDKKVISEEQISTSTVLADTTIVESKQKTKEQKSASYSRQVITTYDEDGVPHEEVIESFEGDEEMRSLMSGPYTMSFVMPPVPAVPNVPPVPAVPSLPFNGSYSYSFDGDTIPQMHYFSDEEAEQWKEFGREMEEKFKNFGANNEEWAHKMEEWAERFSNDFQLHFDEDFGPQMEALTDQFKDFNLHRDFEFRFEDGLKKMEEHLERAREKLNQREEELNKIEKKMEEFESKLQKQLIEDGYLKKGEKVESMNWGDGKLSVNGIKIKEKDIKKYEELTEKYFDGNRGYFIHN